MDLTYYNRTGGTAEKAIKATLIPMVVEFLGRGPNGVVVLGGN